jgi:hypothetical protein
LDYSNIWCCEVPKTSRRSFFVLWFLACFTMACQHLTLVVPMAFRAGPVFNTFPVEGKEYIVGRLQMHHRDRRALHDCVMDLGIFLALNVWPLRARLRCSPIPAYQKLIGRTNVGLEEDSSTVFTQPRACSILCSLMESPSKHGLWKMKQTEVRFWS